MGGFDVLFFGPPSKLPSDLLRSAPGSSSIVDFTGAAGSPPINLTAQQNNVDDFYEDLQKSTDRQKRSTKRQSSRLRNRSSIFQSVNPDNKRSVSISSSRRLRRSRSTKKKKSIELTGLPSQTQKLVQQIFENGTKDEIRRIKAVIKRLRKNKPKDVFLKVYDITDGRASQWLRPLLGTQIEGIWHTGLLCYDKEHFYCNGIQSMSPEVVELKFAMTLRDIMYLGKTRLNQKKFQIWLREQDPKFTREKYDLIDWNCNHWTMLAIPKLFPYPAITYEQTRKKYPKAVSWPALPDYVVDQPRQFMSTVRGRILVWMTKQVLEKVDNFLNKHFAQGLDDIINKLLNR